MCPTEEQTSCRHCTLKGKYIKLLENYSASIERHQNFDQLVANKLLLIISFLRTAPQHQTTTDVIEDLIFLRNLLSVQKVEVEGGEEEGDDELPS